MKGSRSKPAGCNDTQLLPVSRSTLKASREPSQAQQEACGRGWVLFGSRGPPLAQVRGRKWWGEEELRSWVLQVVQSSSEGFWLVCPKVERVLRCLVR